MGVQIELVCHMRSALYIAYIGCRRKKYHLNLNLKRGTHNIEATTTRGGYNTPNRPLEIDLFGHFGQQTLHVHRIRDDRRLILRQLQGHRRYGDMQPVSGLTDLRKSNRQGCSIIPPRHQLASLSQLRV